MKKPHIFLDFDGLKFDTMPMHATYLNQKYGINVTTSDFIGNPYLDLVVNKYLPSPCHVTRDEIYQDISDNLTASLEWHHDVLPIEDMPEVVKALAKKYTFWVVTAREVKGRHVGEHHLESHVP